MIIETEWEDTWREKPPHIFTYFAHYFDLDLDENSFLCNEGEINITMENEATQGSQ